MDSFGHGRKRRARFYLGSVAFLMCILLLWVSPVYSKVGIQSTVCYSIVTLESEEQLKVLAARYNTSVDKINKDNSNVLPLKAGSTITILENPVLEPPKETGKTISRSANYSWEWPLEGWISSPYGWRNGDFHHGLDIAVMPGNIVRAAREGRVVKTGWIGVYGLTVLIDHGGGYQSLYAHNSKILVKVGDRIKSGQGIAISGNTGKTTGPHLHFEVRINGKTVNPNGYLPKIQIAER